LSEELFLYLKITRELTERTEKPNMVKGVNAFSVTRYIEGEKRDLPDDMNVGQLVTVIERAKNRKYRA
jgi:hypothetical protein